MILRLYYDENNLHLDEMTMMSVLYKTTQYRFAKC